MCILVGLESKSGWSIGKLFNKIANQVRKIRQTRNKQCPKYCMIKIPKGRKSLDVSLWTVIQEQTSICKGRTH